MFAAWIRPNTIPETSAACLNKFLSFHWRIRVLMITPLNKNSSLIPAVSETRMMVHTSGLILKLPSIRLGTYEIST